MPKIKLADFGLAKVENLNSGNTFVGTREYLSPHYFAKHEATGAVQPIGMNWALDSYAVGAIAYQL
jgi:serine/threonine protein kinase